MNAEPVTGGRRPHGATARSGLTRRVAARVGVAVLATALTAGCAAGQQAQTADQRPSLDGTNASVGFMGLRGLAIETPPAGPAYEKGAAAALAVVLVNSGPTTDQLTSVTSPAFGGWGTYSATDAKTAQSAGATAAAGGQKVAIAPNTRVPFGVPEAKDVLLLLKSTGKLYPASTVPITFTFARAGTVTVSVPVRLSASGSTLTVPAPSGSGGAEG